MLWSSSDELGTENSRVPNKNLNQLNDLPHPRQALNFPVSRVDFLFIIGERILSPAHDKKKVE